MKPDTTLRLLIVDETANNAETLLSVLRQGGYGLRPRHVGNREGFLAALAERRWDLILCVPQVADLYMADALEAMRHSQRDIPLIVVYDASIDDEHACRVEALAGGAKDAVPKESPEHLRLVVNREVHALNVRRALRRARHAFGESERRCKMLLESSREAVAYIHDGMHVHANLSYLEMFGFENMDEILGLPIMDLVITEDRAPLKDLLRAPRTAQSEESGMDLAVLGPADETIDVHMTFSPAAFDGEDCLQVMVHDKTADAAVNAQLDRLRKRDPLSGLYNREYFLEQLGAAVADAVERESRGFLMYLELDGFQALKETVGLGAADAVVARIAGLLRECIPEELVLARIGDVVFTVLAPSRELSFAERLAEHARVSVEDAVFSLADIEGLEDKSVATSCSIGVAPVLETTTNAAEALAAAHGACRAASRAGGNRVNIQAPLAVAVPEVQMPDRDLVAKVRSALDDDRLALVYQPIVSLKGEDSEIYEVFLRVTDTTGELIPSQRVFAVAGDSDLSVTLDQWVVRHAIETLAKQRAAGHNTRLFLKLTDDAIKDESMLLFIHKQLNQAKLPGEHLVLELSETSALSHVKFAKAFITGLKQLHCGSALEHFGTGLNSINTLRHLPVDYLKLDASFSRSLAENPEDILDVRSITEKALALGKRTVATAVEDTSSLTLLWQTALDFAQGNCIQEPSDELTFDFSTGT